MENNVESAHIQDLLIDIFKLANLKGIDLADFGTQFLKSKEFEDIRMYSDEYYYNPYKVFLNFIANNTFLTKKKAISNDIVIYIGFIYAKFINRTKESTNKILKILPVDKIIANYDLYHTLSEERVIFYAKYEFNIKMNAIRKQRSKQNPQLSFIKEDKNLFIAAHLYNKLFTYPEINALSYRYKTFPYLINDKALIIAKTINAEQEIYQSIHDDAYNPFKFDNPNNILFIFSNKEITLNKDIKSLLINKRSCSMPFDKIFIFDNKKIIFSNISIPSETFYLDINNKDIRDIEIKYKNRYKQ